MAIVGDNGEQLAREKELLQQNIEKQVMSDMQTNPVLTGMDDAEHAKRRKRLVQIYGEAGADYAMDFEKRQREREARDAALLRSVEDTNARMAQMRQQNYEHFLDYVNGVRDAAKTETDEIQKSRDAAAKTGTFTAAGEFANAVANLGSVIAGASNQQPRTYAHDWQREADRYEQELRARNRANRETLAKLSAHLDDLRAGNDMEAIRAKAALEAQRHVLSGQADAARADAQKELAGYARGKSSADAAAARAENAAVNAGANASRAATAARREERLEDKSDNVVTLVFGATEDQPQETIKIEKDALKTTILANIKDLDDLTDEDKEDIKALEYLTSNTTDLANKILPYAKKSPKMRVLLRQASKGATGAVSGDGKAREAEDKTGGAKQFFGIK